MIDPCLFVLVVLGFTANVLQTVQLPFSLFQHDLEEVT